MAFNKARAVQEAERTLAQGKISEAAQLYLDIVENDPSDLAIINLAGDLCVRAQNIPEAIRLFRRLADAYTYQGYVPRAIAICKKILKVEPSNVDAMLKLAGLYSTQGLTREARDLYAQALVVCQNKKLEDKALEVMRRISADEPANIAHRLRLAELYKAAGHLEEAFTTCLEAAEVALTQSNQDVATVAMEQAAGVRPDDRRLDELRRRLSGQPASAERVANGEVHPEAAGAPTLSAEPVSGDLNSGAEETEEAESPIDAQKPEAGLSEIDLSEDWEAMTASQTHPGLSGFDIDDLEIEIDFYLNYGMVQKAFERVEQLEENFPGNAHLAEMRSRLEKRRAAGLDLNVPAGAAGPGRMTAEHGAGNLKSASRERTRAPGRSDFAASLGQLVNELGSEAGPPAFEGDPQTHYELGLAFREMGLVDEAIGELQKAVRGSRPGANRERFLSACSLLALCFVEKQMPALAAKWYTRALKVPGLDHDAILALQYDLAVAYELAGNLEAARENFLEVYGQNIGYRDVAAKIRRLAAGR